MPEPEDAGAVDVAMIRAALEEAATNPDRGIGGSQYAVLGHYTLPKVLNALEHARARAEQLAAALRAIRDGPGGKGGTERIPAAEEAAWARTIAINALGHDHCTAALAGDAPGRGEG